MREVVAIASLALSLFWMGSAAASTILFDTNGGGAGGVISITALDPLPGKAPYELQEVFSRASDDGATVSAIQVGRTRSLTSPADVMRENFDYLG